MNSEDIQFSQLSIQIDNFDRDPQLNNKKQLNNKNFQNQLQQLQNKLYKQIIKPYEQESNNHIQKQLINKLSQEVIYSLEQNRKDIQALRQKLQIPTLNSLEKQQIKQKILQLTMQQLANNRVLVQTYSFHEYRVVIAIFHLSRIYQQLNCHQQVINHLSNALETNRNYVSLKQTFYFHSLLLTYLAYSLCQQEQFQDSLKNLNKALQIHQELIEDGFEVNDFFTLKTISKVLSLLKKNQQAITYGKMALSSAEKHYSNNSFQNAKALKNLAQVSDKVELFDEAIGYLNEGIRILEVHVPQKQETIIEFYTKLTEITLSKLNKNSVQNFEPYIQVLKKRYNVIESIYGYRDKRSIKQKRHLASSYLKYYKINQAEEELEDILEIQSLVYGQKSVEVGKTLKLLGTVAISLKSLKKAEKYLKKSQGIFHDQGHTNLQKQVAAKLLILTADLKQRSYNKV